MEDLASSAELERGRPQMEVVPSVLEEKGQPGSVGVPRSYQHKTASVAADEWEQCGNQPDWRERVNAGEAVPVETETIAGHCIRVRE